MRNGENLYEIIAGNIRRERKRLSLTQAKLAERADVSIDTVKSIENGRSLDTYLNIVQALETSPLALMSREQPEQYIERFIFMMNRCNEREIEFALHMVEQLLKGQDNYLSK